MDNKKNGQDYVTFTNKHLNFWREAVFIMSCKFMGIDIYCYLEEIL
jgi:hypothetical protein